MKRAMTPALTPAIAGDLATAIRTTDARLVWDFIDDDGHTVAIDNALGFIADDGTADINRIAKNLRRETGHEGRVRRIDWLEL